MFILDSNRFVRDAAGVSGQIAKTIEKAGGEVLVSRLWEERKLAYPIDGHKKGTYWLTYFRIDSSKLKALEREFQLNETVVRNLFLKLDPRVAEHLVAIARGDVVAATASPGDEESSAADS
jgi:small subunit ribosomal protein S6